ncbi:MAG: hypothetical protein HFG97_16290 [Dorea sp.]|nr:hypothetical protein [Dorea sp.]
MGQFDKAMRRTDDLLVYFKHQCTDEVIYGFYVPKNTGEDKLKEAADCVEREIEIYGQEHAHDYAEIDEPEIIAQVLDRLGIPYYETSPNYEYYL